MFILNQRLRDDTVEIINLNLSRILLMKDKSFPWLILVPEKEDIKEIYELTAKDRAILIEEISLASQIIETLYTPDKINIGMLGNIVPQLHIHVIGRFKTDCAWPGSAWGACHREPYSEEGLRLACMRFKEAFTKFLK